MPNMHCSVCGFYHAYLTIDDFKIPSLRSYRSFPLVGVVPVAMIGEHKQLLGDRIHVPVVIGVKASILLSTVIYWK
jgi:hypothetical protein